MKRTKKNRPKKYELPFIFYHTLLPNTGADGDGGGGGQMVLPCNLNRMIFLPVRCRHYYNLINEKHFHHGKKNNNNNNIYFVNK